MILTSNQLALMLERSSKIDRLKNSCAMNERYYRILYLFQRRKQEERNNYVPNVHVSENNNYNKIIIGHNTTTWTKADKKQSRDILKRMESRRRY